MNPITKYLARAFELVVICVIAEICVHPVMAALVSETTGYRTALVHAAVFITLAGPFMVCSVARMCNASRDPGTVHRTANRSSLVVDMCLAAGCSAIGLGILASVTSTAATRRSDALAAFRVQEHSKSLAVQARAQDIFLETYQHLRTVARLPGVKEIDRYAANFDADAKTTVQEIYNNLAQSVPVSELYIVPLDLEPDSLDTITGRPQEPITTFDQLIVGKVGGAKEPVSDSVKNPEEQELEETEIYEYRLMKDQLALLKEKFPRETDFEGLEYPAICGPQVITCDNSRFDPKQPDDEDRSGIVYSVPFYGPDGMLKGCISAVSLSTRIQEVIGDPDRALVYAAGKYAAVGKAAGGASGMATQHKEHVFAGVPRVDLLYSEVLALPIRDLGGQWKVWAAADDAGFLESPNVHMIARDEQIGCVVASIASLLFAVMTWSMRSAKRRAEALAHSMTNDLTLAKAAAEAANRSKSAFLANMSHEIRTPLTAILGFADVLREDGNLGLAPDHRIETIDTIRSAGRHLLVVINDILDLSKIEAEKLMIEKVDTPLVAMLHEIESILRPRASGKNLSINATLVSPVPEHIFSDPTRLRQILMNLAGNAVKFTTSGHVKIAAQVLTIEGVQRLLIDIEDSGLGMTTEQSSRLFMAFGQADETVTRKFGGTGLGLTISRRLAGLMGGDVTLLHSAPGQGSTFRVDLPLEPVPGTAMIRTMSAVQATPESKVSANAIKLTGRILFAEDGPDNQRLISFHLRRAGAVVDIAANGRIALELVEKSLAAGTPYSLLLTDMQMPELDGYSLARTLRQRGSTIPIIALTAHAMAEDRDKCTDAGCDDYATKPIDTQMLLSTCAKWMGMSHASLAESRKAAA